MSRKRNQRRKFEEESSTSRCGKRRAVNVYSGGKESTLDSQGLRRFPAGDARLIAEREREGGCEHWRVNLERWRCGVKDVAVSLIVDIAELIREMIGRREVEE